MNINLNNITLAQLQELNPQAFSALERFLVSSYDDFIESIYSSLKWAIKELQENPQHHRDSTEDQITHYLISILRAQNFNAFSDTETGGHVDIRIDKPGTDYLWLGEAKKDNSLNHVYEGFLQLTTRYATSATNQTQGGILIYILKKKATNFINDCKNNLIKKQIPNLKVSDDLENPLFFQTVSNIPRMGDHLSFKIRHLGISLYFSPKDHSGRNAKKYNETVEN